MTKEQYIAAISKQRKIQAELNNIYMPVTMFADANP